ncbi:afadin-like [Oppia nitens]|uniref:afadin-like n=1 Tax=Oppia nitens TaxID=1686743 RepID=UPI0023DBF031|nr:afadin-like [Oppia nitens]
MDDMDKRVVQERDHTEHRQHLVRLINEWNANRVDLFSISEPNDALEFHGVMRYYFQDAGAKVATKCIRVASTATSRDVINILIEKFRPDIRMLSVPEYGLYEVHENGDERKLAEEELPLLVQLNWHRDDREGRFLLRRMNDRTCLPGIGSAGDENKFKRKLSKREKKEQKKREKQLKAKGGDNKDGDNKDSLAEKLYTEMPETSFTRSISNPEAVMRRRRQQKLEKKLQQYSQEGGVEAGGTLRIFGESINPDVPYKTILLSDRDTASHAVKEILEKYGKEKEDPNVYCLVQLIVPVSNGDVNSIADLHNSAGIREYILDDDDCPLSIEKAHNKARGVLTFHIRRRPADYQPRKKKKKPKQIKGEMEAGFTKYDESLEKLPYLVETNPDGSEITKGMPKKHYLYVNMTEVGSERSSSTNHVPSQCLQLYGPNVQARHCVIAHTEGIVTVTPSSRDAETYVNGIRIYETTILRHGMLVRFGKIHTFKFIDPLEDQSRQLSPSLMRGTVHGSLRKMPEDIRLAAPHSRGSYETTFDADGNVETTSLTSRDERLSKKSDEPIGAMNGRPMMGNGVVIGGDSSQQSLTNSVSTMRKGTDPILPAILELWQEREDAFLNQIINLIDPNGVQFKLSVTYTIYMAFRFRASTHFKPEITPEERAHRLTSFANKVANLIHRVIEDRYHEPSHLAFWLANSSELLHFLKQDKHLSAFTFDAQDILAEAVQFAFRSLVICEHSELQTALPAILEDCDDSVDDNVTVTTSKLLIILSNAMGLLRRCRVNAALTIQLFSQLFHYINMWLFNKVIGCTDSTVNYCTRVWAQRIRKRLIQMRVWAEKQGLELAADCHLNCIVQTAHLLQSPKSNPEDITAISEKCSKLNSLQMRQILERYEPSANEPPIPREMIEALVKVAEVADEMARQEGRDVQLEEEPDLQLPFLLPEDGYSCEIVSGIPSGLIEFVQPMVQMGLCQVTVQPTSCGDWTIYMMSIQSSPKIRELHPPNVGPETQTDSGPGPTQPPSMSTAPMSMTSSLLMTQPTLASSQGPPPPHLQMQMGPPSTRGSTASAFSEPEVQLLKLQKSNNGMGLSIVAARGVTQSQDRLGIYIKSVVKGGAADLDGRLKAGDQLLKVDGNSLIGITQERAAELMTQTGPIVTLEVAKQGAIYHGLAGILAQPSPSIARGYGNPRRMSERDIPSRVNHEQELQMRAHRNNMNASAQHLQHQQQQSRIQASKSVPTLVDGGPMTQSNGGVPPPPSVLQQHRRIANEIPPPYSGPPTHPQFNSMPKSMSEFNSGRTNEMRNYGTHHPIGNYNTIGANYSPSRPDSQLSIHSQQRMSQSQQLYPEERHYQNIQLYQINPKPSPNSAPQRIPMHSSHQSLQADGQQYATQNARPISAHVAIRDSDQYIGQMPNSPTTPTSPRPPLGMNPNMMTTGDHFQYSQQQYPNQGMGGRVDYNETQPIIEYPSRNYPPPHPPYGDSRQRDLMRQEAKMDEIREEVKRREDRTLPGGPYMNSQLRVPGGQPNGQWAPPPRQQPYYPSQQMPMNGGSHMRMMPPPPQPAPKPKSSAAQLLQNYGQNNSYNRNSYQQDAIPQQQPPPPPPNVSYRYGPSGYPPSRQSEPLRSPNTGSQKTPFTDALNNSRVINNNNNNDLRKTQSGVVSPSPWEREEKERAIQQRLEESKRNRDEEIKYLEALPYRTPQHEERLRKLLIEKEFQRRADEMGGDEEEEEDDEVLDRADNRERMLSMKQDIERTRQRRVEREQQLKQQQQNFRPNLEEWAKRTQLNNHNNQLEAQEERLRQLRLEENRRHQELEAAQMEEEKLIREAKRRQDEELRYRGFIPSSKTQSFASQVVDKYSNEIPPPLPNSPPPLEAPQRLDRLLMTTSSAYQSVPPPKSEYNSTLDNSSKYPSALRNGDLSDNANHIPKKVSWNDTPAEAIEDEDTERLDTDVTNHQNSSFTLQDIDEALGNHSDVAGNTPGVIGAQEVYNDPRQRIEARRSAQIQRPAIKPEKLSFQEKMKMFGEVSQQESLKSKVNISKAQREIENDGQPSDSNGTTGGTVEAVSMITTSS